MVLSGVFGVPFFIVLL